MVITVWNTCNFAKWKVSGLQLVKPRFKWDAKDKLTEIEQFKADCKILFDGPLCNLKDKQKAGLIINWLGREATQILTSVDAEINSTQEVFEVLEKVFRLESNHILAQFKFEIWNRETHKLVTHICQNWDLHCLNVSIKMMWMNCWRISSYLEMRIRRSSFGWDLWDW